MGKIAPIFNDPIKCKVKLCKGIAMMTDTNCQMSLRFPYINSLFMK